MATKTTDRELRTACRTGRQWGFYAKDHGAAVVEEINGKMYVEAIDKKAVLFPAGELKPHASLHIGRILRWMLMCAIGLLLLIAGSSGPLAGLILKLFG